MRRNPGTFRRIWNNTHGGREDSQKVLIDRTRSALHPGDTKKVRKTNLKGNQMPEQGHRFISYSSITMYN